MDQLDFETCSIIKLKYKTLWIICLAFLTILSVMHILSYFLIIPKELLWSFFVPLFLFQLLAIQDYNTKSGFEFGKKPCSSQIKIHIKPWMVLVSILLYINFAFHFFSGVSFRGVPEILDRQYVVNEHGAYTIVSEEIYRNAVMTRARLFSAIFILFNFLHFCYFKCTKTNKSSNQLI